MLQTSSQISNTKWTILSLLIWLTACASSNIARKPSTETNALAELRRQIDTVLQDSSLAQSRTGIKIVSLRSGEVLYERDSHLLFHPASNMKLLTTATALTKLGPDFRFKTVLYADTSSVQDSTISGNIYLKGFGNPDLTSSDLRWIAQQLKYNGIKRINGDLVCDDTYLDDLYWGSGWMWDDVSAWYWAPIGALTVDDNCVTVRVKPGSKIGDSLIVQLQPNTSYMKIANFGLTVDSLDTIQLKNFEVERKWREPENTVVIEGGRALTSAERKYVIDVVNSTLYTGTLFSEILQDEDIAFDGQVSEGIVPDTNIVLVKHLSEPLTSVIINTNKISDNLSAELILKTLGAEIMGVPGTAQKGISAINHFFYELDVDTTTYRLADGSGVSRYNIVHPAQIIELLKAMHENFAVQAEFKASLPIAGVDGTLEDRMKNGSAQRKLRAKTGSLNGVSSLAGYTTTADGEPLAFSMIIEHFLVPTSKIRNIQDRIGILISSFSRKRVALTSN